jgi:hypothetical protein
MMTGLRPPLRAGASDRRGGYWPEISERTSLAIAGLVSGTATAVPAGAICVVGSMPAGRIAFCGSRTVFWGSTLVAVMAFAAIECSVRMVAVLGVTAPMIWPDCAEAGAGKSEAVVASAVTARTASFIPGLLLISPKATTAAFPAGRLAFAAAWLQRPVIARRLANI